MHKWSFFNIIYTFLCGYNSCFTNTVYAVDPNNSVIKRLLCTSGDLNLCMMHML